MLAEPRGTPSRKAKGVHENRSTPLNISPDDRTLFLRESDTRICIYDLDEEACRDFFDTQQLADSTPL